MTAVPPALDTRRHAGRLPAPRAARASRRRWWRPRSRGSAPRGRPHAPTRSPRRCACRRSDLGRRAGSPTPASACCRSAPRCRSPPPPPDPPSPTTTSCGSTGARSASPTALFYSGRGNARPGRAARRVRGSRRRLPRPPAAALAREGDAPTPARQRRRRALRVRRRRRKRRAAQQARSQRSAHLRRGARSGSSLRNRTGRAQTFYVAVDVQRGRATSTPATRCAVG